MKNLILFLVLSVTTVLAHAVIEVDINPSTINEGESFQLILTRDTQAPGEPDLSVLQTEFMILGTARQMSYSVINGQSTSASQWIITLRALKSGVLSIPAIKIGSELSTPMTINVVARAKAKAGSGTTWTQAHDLLLTTSVDNDKPYVNQQVLYTVKLYNSKRLLDADYQPPQVENALLIPLGNALRYQTIKNNVNYVVEEQKYALFPQKSGSLRITSPSFTALVYAYNPQRVEVHGKNQHLNVQPIPKLDQGHPWTPAKQIQLTEHYEQEVQSINQGEALVRTVRIDGVALPAQLLPELKFEQSNLFHVYPEKGAEQNKVQQGELVGRTEFKVTYLFNKPGKVVIPELRVRWFNTQTGHDEETRLPSKSLEVVPVPSKVNTKNDAEQQAYGAIQQEKNIESSVVSRGHNDVAWWCAAFFACAWIVTLVLWFWKQHGRISTRKQRRLALKQLKKACFAGNALEARDALLKWASVSWTDVTIVHLSDLTPLVPESEFKKQLTLLSQALYKENQDDPWSGHELFRAASEMKTGIVKMKSKKEKLPPINP